MTPLPKKSPARSTVVKRSPVKSKGKAKAVQEPEEEDEGEDFKFDSAIGKQQTEN